MWMLVGGTKSLPCYFEDGNQIAVTGKALNTIHFNIYYVDGTSSLAHDATRELGNGWYSYDYTDTDGVDFVYAAIDTTTTYKNFPGAFVELQTKSVDNVWTDTPGRVWANASRTLTSFGTLVADISTAVWSATTRTLTDFAALAHDVWEYLTSNITTTGSIGKFIIDKLNSLTGGSGGYVVTIQYYETSTTTPIVQAQVVVRDSSDSSVLTTLITGVDGKVIFNLPAATYHISAYKLGQYSFTNPQTLIVTGNISVTYYGSPFVVPSPSTPGVCRVYGWEYRVDGTPYDEILVTAQLQAGPYFASSVGVLVTERQVYTDINGYWQLDLTQSAAMTPTGAQYLIEVPEQNYSKTVTIPTAATVNYKDLT